MSSFRSILAILQVHIIPGIIVIHQVQMKCNFVVNETRILNQIVKGKHVKHLCHARE